MKLKIKHFDAKVFEKKMEHLKDINFTLFMDDIPTKPEDSSEINILVLHRPWGLEIRSSNNRIQWHQSCDSTECPILLFYSHSLEN